MPDPSAETDVPGRRSGGRPGWPGSADVRNCRPEGASPRCRCWSGFDRNRHGFSGVVPFIPERLPFVGSRETADYVTWTGSQTAPTVWSMGNHHHDVNVALARCDLERVLRDHLRAGADPGRLLGELLEMCVNLRALAEDPGVPRGSAGLVVSELPGSQVSQSPGGGQGDLDRPTYAGMKVRRLRPVAGISRSPGRDHVERKPDPDERLPYD